MTENSGSADESARKMQDLKAKMLEAFGPPPPPLTEEDRAKAREDNFIRALRLAEVAKSPNEAWQAADRLAGALSQHVVSPTLLKWLADRIRTLDPEDTWRLLCGPLPKGRPKSGHDEAIRAWQGRRHALDSGKTDDEAWIAAYEARWGAGSYLRDLDAERGRDADNLADQRMKDLKRRLRQLDAD